MFATRNLTPQVISKRPAMNAASHGHAECLRLLLDHGADANVQGGPFERAPLLCAVTTGREDVVGLLLARGANVEVRDWQGNSAIDWARRRGDTRIILSCLAKWMTRVVPRVSLGKLARSKTNVPKCSTKSVEIRSARR